LVAVVLGVVVEDALVSVDAAPVVLVVLPVVPIVPVALVPAVPAVPDALIVPLVPAAPALDDIAPLPLICIGGQGLIDVVLPAVVCWAPAVAAIAAVSAIPRLAARHRDVRCVVPCVLDIVSSSVCPAADPPRARGGWGTSSSAPRSLAACRDRCAPRTTDLVEGRCRAGGAMRVPSATHAAAPVRRARRYGPPFASIVSNSFEPNA
jgi:hypothetical protein